MYEKYSTYAREHNKASNRCCTKTKMDDYMRVVQENQYMKIQKM